MKIKEIKVTVPLSSLAARIFGDSDPVPMEETPSAPEYEEANAEMKDINKQIRKQEMKDLWKL